MTEHDLSTLVRDHISSDEPPFAGPQHVIARGRRTVRKRRLAAGAGMAAVLAVAGAIVVPQLGADPDGSTHGIDPVTQEALDNYDAQAMPRIIEVAAREVFSESVPDLGPGDFAAYDGNATEIGPEHYAKASNMGVSFGDRETRELSVDLMHAKGEAEGDHEKLCAEELEMGYYLECDVRTLGNGDVLVTNTTALRPFGRDAEMWYAVTRDELATRNPDNLWFQQHAEVIKSDSFLTAVQETVKAPSLAAAKEAFLVPIDDLAALASDRNLVLPKPPADELGGCPQWILPGSGVSCGDSGAHPAPAVGVAPELEAPSDLGSSVPRPADPAGRD